MEEKSDLAAFLGEIESRGIAVFSDRFLYASPAFCRGTGWGNDAILGVPVQELLLSPLDATQKNQEISLRHAVDEIGVLCELVFFDPPRLGMIVLKERSGASRFLDSQALHDIRNPLNTILGYGRIFHDDQQLPSRFRQAADSIVKAAEQIRTKLGGIAKPATTATRPASNKKGLDPLKILIVDDDMDNRTVLGLFLKKNPLTLLFANNGASAYEITAEEQPDLIFMDLHMPDMDGREAAEKIKKSFPEIKIVALTADVLAVEEADPRTRIFDRKLHKPFDRKEIRNTIAELTGVMLASSRPVKEARLPTAAPIAPSRMHEILTFTKSGHITELEALIGECREPEVKAYLTDRLAHFDLDGIIRWAENGLNHGR